MIRKLWDATFHLEGKFLRSCWQLFIPGKVTTEFFKGKQDRYPHPLRMFAIVMFLFLFMVNTLLNRQHDKSGTLFSLDKTVPVENGDSVVQEKKSLGLYELMKYKTLLNDMRQDYENMPAAWKTKESRKAVDSLLRKNNFRNGLEDEAGLPDSLDLSTDTTNIGLWGNRQLHLATSDMVRYEPDELIERYNIDDWLLKVMIRQSLKSYKNPEGLVHAYIGSLTWAILALVALMSGVLALLYRRQKRYYVEHFIFLLHFHTGLMLALLLVLIGAYFKLWKGFVFLSVLAAASIFMFAAMRRYYGQSRRKTFAKWVVFGILYYFGFLLLFILGIILVFAIY